MLGPGVLPRIGSLFAQRGVQVITAGILSGAVGGSTLVATGLVPVGAREATPPTVELVACPGSGPVLARVTSGQSLLVTARSEDGQWLEVYIGAPGVAHAWAPAVDLSLQSGGDSLPVDDCSAPATPVPATAAPTPLVTAVIATATPAPTPSSGPSPGPSPSPTAKATARPTASPTTHPTPTPTTHPTPTPTTKPTPTIKPTPSPTVKPPPTPTPTPADTTPPVLSGLNSQYQCFGAGGSSVISVIVTDPDDSVASATIGVTPPGMMGTLYAMHRNKFNASEWDYTIVAPTTGWNTAGYVHYEVRATDSHGNYATAQSADAAGTTNALWYQPGGCIF
jgi:hypothetical protein